MKKSLTYTTMAVVFGVALMLTPLLLTAASPLTPTGLERGAQTYGTQPFALPSVTTLQKATIDSERGLGITPNYPLDAISVGLILSVGLVLALIVSAQLKKKIV